MNRKNRTPSLADLLPKVDYNMPTAGEISTLLLPKQDDPTLNQLIDKHKTVNTWFISPPQSQVGWRSNLPSTYNIDNWTFQGIRKSVMSYLRQEGRDDIAKDFVRFTDAVETSKQTPYLPIDLYKAITGTMNYDVEPLPGGVFQHTYSPMISMRTEYRLKPLPPTPDVANDPLRTTIKSLQAMLFSTIPTLEGSATFGPLRKVAYAAYLNSLTPEQRFQIETGCDPTTPIIEDAPTKSTNCGSTDIELE